MGSADPNKSGLPGVIGCPSDTNFFPFLTRKGTKGIVERVFQQQSRREVGNLPATANSWLGCPPRHSLYEAASPSDSNSAFNRRRSFVMLRLTAELRSGPVSL